MMMMMIMLLNVLVDLEPKDTLSIYLECCTRFAINDAKEGRYLISYTAR